MFNGKVVDVLKSMVSEYNYMIVAFSPEPSSHG